MYSPRLYLRDWLISSPLALSFVAQVLMWWYMFQAIRPAGEQAFLHYNTIFGVDLVGPWWQLIYMPLTGFGILALNYTLSYHWYQRDRFLARCLSLLSGACQAGAFFALYLLAAINS